jgi:hypothetical protein
MRAASAINDFSLAVKVSILQNLHTTQKIYLPWALKIRLFFQALPGSSSLY